MDPRAGDEVFLFECFRFDRRAGGLFCVGESNAAVLVPLGARALDVLGLLLARAGGIVSKDEIIAAVWPGRIVEDSNLPTQILALRRVLDRGRAQGSCIQTVSGRGYSFVASVTRGEVAAATLVAAVEAQPGSARRSLISRHALIAASLVAAVGIGSAAWWGWPHSGSPPAALEAPGSQKSLSAAGITANPAPRLSIVVLPFANLSSEPEQEYFAESITDDLTADLSRLPGNFVIAHGTASVYKGKPVDAKQIGHDLGVRYVLEGSVRRLGEEVQVTAQLIDAETGAHVWADRFDTDRRDPAKAQSEITSRLAWSVHVELVQAAARQIAQEKSSDPRDLVIRGWAALYGPNTRGNRLEAVQAFGQALKLDPKSADAKVGIATVLVFNISSAYTKSPKEDMARAEPLLTEALESNDDNSRAHLAMGMLRRYQERLDESRIELEKALAIDPNYATAHNHLGWTLIAMGEPAPAIPHFEKALRLDPQYEGVYAYYAGAGYCYLLLNRADQAVDFLEKARVANRRIWYIQLLLASALGLRGDIDEAKAALAEFLKIKPGLNSLAKVRAFVQGNSSPKLLALEAKTSDIGAQRAGLPDK